MLWFFGTIILAFQEVTGVFAFPIAAVFWMVGYIPLTVGAFSGLRLLGTKLSAIAVVVSIMAILVLFIDYAILALIPLINSDISIFQKIFETILSAEGVLLGIPLIFTLLTMKYEGYSQTWMLLTGGLAMIAVANLIWVYQPIRNLITIAAFSIMWMPGYLLIGTTSVHELEAQKDRLEQKDDLRAA